MSQVAGDRAQCLLGVKSGGPSNTRAESALPS
jgi:hypothetical protein